MHQYNVIPPRRRHPADDRPEEYAADPHELHEDDRDNQVRHRRRHGAILAIDKNARRLAVDLHHALEVIGREIIDDDDQHAVRQQVIRPDPRPDKRLEHREEAHAEHRHHKIARQAQTAKNKRIPVRAFSGELVADARGCRLKNTRHQVLENLDDHVVVIIDTDGRHIDHGRNDQVIRRRTDRRAHLVQRHRIHAGKNILPLPLGERLRFSADIGITAVNARRHHQVRHYIFHDEQYRVDKK